jgi:hypothetical protein
MPNPWPKVTGAPASAIAEEHPHVAVTLVEAEVARTFDIE